MQFAAVPGGFYPSIDRCQFRQWRKTSFRSVAGTPSPAHSENHPLPKLGANQSSAGNAQASHHRGLTATGAKPCRYLEARMFQRLPVWPAPSSRCGRHQTPPGRDARAYL